MHMASTISCVMLFMCGDAVESDIKTKVQRWLVTFFLINYSSLILKFTDLCKVSYLLEGYDLSKLLKAWLH